MIERPNHQELCSLVDWLWTEGQFPMGVADVLPPERSWVLESALREHQQSTDEREARARELYYGDDPASIVVWDDLLEEERNEWRAKAKAPSYRPMAPRPLPTV